VSTADEKKPQHDESVLKAIDGLQDQISLVTNIRAPNTPIPNFELPTEEFFSTWKGRLLLASRDEFIATASRLLEELEIPELEGTDRAREHLELCYEISRLRDQVISMISTAAAVGYSRTLSILAPGDDFAPQLTEIKGILGKITKQVESLSNLLFQGSRAEYLLHFLAS
jgi:hypothetical protein